VKPPSVPALRWTNGADGRHESVPVEYSAELRTQSAHARRCPVAARCGTAKNLQYQTVRGSRTWACSSRHTDVRSRAPHRCSVCGGAGCLLTVRRSRAHPGDLAPKQSPRARQYSMGSPSQQTFLWRTRSTCPCRASRHRRAHDAGWPGCDAQDGARPHAGQLVLVANEDQPRLCADGAQQPGQERQVDHRGLIDDDGFGR
jgi:hypothetical protein